MKPIPAMNIDMALSYMSRKKAIELMWRRLFCNTDETINVIAEHDMRKQIPQKPIKDDAQDFQFVTKYTCPACGDGFTGTGVCNYCYHCGQALDWSDCIES